MDLPELTSRVIKHGKQITALLERAKTTDRIMESLQTVSGDMRTLAEQIKSLQEQLNKIAINHEERFREQGKRIGGIEGKAGIRWEQAVTQVIGLIIAAGFALVITKMGG